MHAELLLQGVAWAEADSTGDMEVSLDELDRKELQLCRDARAAAAARDADKAKRLMEGDLTELELKRRRLSEQPAATQPIA